MNEQKFLIFVGIACLLTSFTCFLAFHNLALAQFQPGSTTNVNEIYWILKVGAYSFAMAKLCLLTALVKWLIPRMAPRVATSAEYVSP